MGVVRSWGRGGRLTAASAVREDNNNVTATRARATMTGEGDGEENEMNERQT